MVVIVVALGHFVLGYLVWSVVVVYDVEKMVDFVLSVNLDCPAS